MARLKKQTVDYFPHPVNNGSRMFVMEQTYGDKGYCCYYKLLEQIGKAEGHFIDFSVKKNILFFSAQLRCTEDEAISMLKTLCSLDVIDRNLWDEKRIAWCQEFIDNVSDLYTRRKVNLPTKERIFEENQEDVVNEEREQKIWCRNVTNKAVQKGIIKKLPCSICGTIENIQAHHEDYSDPYNVKWLCKTHHDQLHSEKCKHNVDINTQSKVKENKEKQIKEKKRIFIASLQPFVEEFGKDLVNDFYIYWSEEKIENGKLRYELQPTWSLAGRLAKWRNNNKKFNGTKSDSNSRKTSVIALGDSARQLLSDPSSFQLKTGD